MNAPHKLQVARILQHRRISSTISRALQANVAGQCHFACSEYDAAIRIAQLTCSAQEIRLGSAMES